MQQAIFDGLLIRQHNFSPIQDKIVIASERFIQNHKKCFSASLSPAAPNPTPNQPTLM